MGSTTRRSTSRVWTTAAAWAAVEPSRLRGGGLGVVGLILYVIVGALGGGDVSQLAAPSGTQVHGSDETAGELEQRCNIEGAIDRYNDCFLIKI